MDSNNPTPGGILDSVRSLAEGLFAAVQDRIALASLEFEEESHRQIRILAWISALVFTGTMSLSFATFTVVYLFWESARLAVLGALALLYLAAFLGLALAFRRFLARQKRPFDATLQALGADRQCIRDGN